MNRVSPCPRVSVVSPKPRPRRGQTLILALAILFLFVVLGGIFITMVGRNLQRTGRQGGSDDAVTLALAGLQHAAQQFRSSPDGADWRPAPTEFLWRTPQPPPAAAFSIPFPSADPTYDLNTDGVLDPTELRQLDPDKEWLSNANPYVRIATDRGRFLLRVTYMPRFQAATAAGVADEFDRGSGMIHIESLGRPGEFDPNDPSFYLQDPTAEGVTNPVGQVHKVEAFVPVGLVDQLLWITNYTNERGPATLGAGSFQSGDGRRMEYPSLFYGGVRSEVDLQVNGRNVIRLYPARGDTLSVKGQIRTTERRNVMGYATTLPQLQIAALDDTGQAAGNVIPPDQGDDDITNDAQLTTFIINADNDVNTEYTGKPLVSQGGELRPVLQDERHLRANDLETGRSARGRTAPLLTQLDASTGVDRWLMLTRDSGGTIQVQDTNPLSGNPRLVNAGAYGLTDFIPPPGLTPAEWNQIRAKGLYLDNWGDIQSPGDRRRVKTAWLKPQSDLGQRYGWSADFSQYVPSSDEENVNHPITEVLLTRVMDASGNLKPVIRITRYDLDPRQMNVPPSTGRRRQFYDLGNAATGGPYPAGTLVPSGEDKNLNGVLDPGEDLNGNGELDGSAFVRDFDVPENGVFLAEGSIRIRGTWGVSGQRARPLTVVSRGTIYIEGSLIQETPGWQIGLLAHDFVTFNPTALQRVNPGPGVDLPRPDMPGQPEKGHHYTVNQGQFIDFITNSAAALNETMVFLKHAGQMGDDAVTGVVLNQPRPGVWPQATGDWYNFGANAPAAAPPYDPPDALWQGQFYGFRDISPGDNNYWNQSDHRSVEGGPDQERKAFFLPTAGSAGPWPGGLDAIFRMEVVPKDTLNSMLGMNPGLQGTDQPYWFSRAAVLPADRPLSVRVEAVMYAFTGSWFVIPPPYFNDQDEDDSRQQYFARVAAGQTALRAQGTYPNNVGWDPNAAVAAQQYPFFKEPLNVDIQVIGAITENMPANPSEVAEWTRRLATLDLDTDGNVNGTVDANGNLDLNEADNDPTVWPPTDPNNPAAWTNRRARFSPRLTYRYDYNLKRMARVRVVSHDPNAATGGLPAGYEEVVWITPPADPAVAGTLRSLGAVVAEAGNSYVHVLPVLPRLPASSVVYSGNPL